MTAKNVNENGEKLYKRYDLQDESDFEIETLEEMKTWLADHWENNPNDDMDDEDVEKLCEEIMASDAGELFDRLAGIDYSYYELDEDGNEICDELEPIARNMEQNLATGYSVRLEDLDGKNLQVTVVRAGEKNIYTTELPDSEEGWNEIFKKEVEVIREEARVVREEERRARAKENCECDNEESRFVQDHGVCMYCYHIG